MMTAKTNYIQTLAGTLRSGASTMTFGQLANDLNSKGFTDNYGKPFVGGRGVAKLVDSVYYRLDAQGLSADCDNVAKAFTNAKGVYAY